MLVLKNTVDRIYKQCGFKFRSVLSKVIKKWLIGECEKYSTTKGQVGEEA